MELEEMMIWYKAKEDAQELEIKEMEEKAQRQGFRLETLDHQRYAIRMKYN